MQSTFTSNLRRLLLPSLELQRSERELVGWMILYAGTAFGGVITTGYTVSDALFLSRLPVSATPYLFIAPGVAIVLTLLAYNAISARIRFEKVALGTSAGLLVTAVAFRILLSTPFQDSFVLLASLSLFAEVAATLILIQFWIFATQLFNLREAKRLFGVIMLGATVANIAAGLSLLIFVRLIGAENLLLLVIAALGVCTLSSFRLGRKLRERSQPSSKTVSTEETPSLRQHLQDIVESPLLLGIAGLTVILSLLVNLAAYQFFLAVQASFPDQEQKLVLFLGRYEIFTGSAALLVQIYLATYVTRQLGIFVALLFFPLGVAVAAAFGLISAGAVLVMALIRAADPIFRRTINDAALNMLYLPVPAQLRAQAKELLEALYALTFALAGVIFLLTQRVPGWRYVHWSFPLIGLAIAWILLLRWTWKQYLGALHKNLAQRRLEPESITLDLTMEPAFSTLVGALADPDETRVLHALQLIGSPVDSVWHPHLTALLKHPSAEVRIQALAQLKSAEGTGYAESIAALLEAPEERVRAAAIDTYCALAGSHSLEPIAPYLSAAGPRVKGAAVTGLLLHGNSHQTALAGKALAEMLTSDEAAERRHGARVLGSVQKVPGLDIEATLLALLSDPRPEVQQEAILATAILTPPNLLSRLISLLEDGTTAQEAAQALSSYGEQAIAPLSTLYSDQTKPLEARKWAVCALAKLGTPVISEGLVVSVEQADPELRTELYRALSGLQKQGSHPISSPDLRHLFQIELQEAYALYQLQHDLCSTPPNPLLADVLETRLRQAQDRLFSLLGLAYPDQGLARTALRSQNSHEHGLAIELLDTVMTREDKTLVLPLFEGLDERIRARAYEYFEVKPENVQKRLDELAGSHDLWLRACALLEIAQKRLTSLQ
ncbi:MAG: hypothetical protein JSV66_01820, partial [Trueperaceae bacterium]